MSIFARAFGKEGGYDRLAPRAGAISVAAHQLGAIDTQRTASSVILVRQA